MKKIVLDIRDLQQLAPVFKKKWAAFLGKRLMKWLNIGKVNTIHARYSHLRGAEFTSAILADPMMDVKFGNQANQHIECDIAAVAEHGFEKIGNVEGYRHQQDGRTQ